MSKPKHILLLQYLSDHGVGVTINVSTFMAENFPKPETLNVELFNKESRKPILFIRDLYNRDFIGSDTNPNHWAEIPYPFHASHLKIPRWYEDFETPLYVTSKGLDYLDQYNRDNLNHELNESFRNVNEASIKNYKTQSRLSILTAVLAGASALISLSSNYKTDETAINVEKLRQELRQWRIEAKKRPSQITYPVVQPRKQ